MGLQVDWFGQVIWKLLAYRETLNTSVSDQLHDGMSCHWIYHNLDYHVSRTVAVWCQFVLPETYYSYIGAVACCTHEKPSKLWLKTGTSWTTFLNNKFEIDTKGTKLLWKTNRSCDQEWCTKASKLAISGETFLIRLLLKMFCATIRGAL